MGFAIAGAVAAGGLLASNAAAHASTNESNAAGAASDVQESEFEQTRADQKPYLDSGYAALNQINGNMADYNKPFSMSDFQEDPGYQFRMDQANQAIERSAAARGGLDSGDTLKALTNYNQDAASAEYNNAYNRYTQQNQGAFNRLASVAGIGQTAANTDANAGASTAASIGSNIMSGANASAAGSIAQANNVNNVIGQGMNTWMGYQMMNRLNGAANPPGTNSPY